MTESERAELEALKRRQAALLEAFNRLSNDVRAMETRLSRPTEAAQPAKPATPEVRPVAPVEPPKAVPPKLPVPPKPVLPPETVLAKTQAGPAVPPQPAATPEPPKIEVQAQAIEPLAPAPIPPVIARPVEPVEQQIVPQPVTPIISGVPEPKPKPAAPPPPVPPLESVLAQQRMRRPAAAQSGGVPPKSPTPEPARSGDASFEMRLGKVWLVRIGIVMVLTSLVFFGAYAYQNYIPHLGAGGKVAMLYLAGGVLLALGTWLPRKEEKLRNYGQVLVAGGLAAVYFTTYAAYHYERLRIIASPVTDGVLLLAWAGFIIWLADRKKSEVMALLAVLLAYYSSGVTHAALPQPGLFTLYSNLVLTVAAVVFLLRNRWATLSFASLVATYAGYAFWRFYRDGQWQWAPPGDLWSGNYFLICYWIIFTVAVFMSRHEQFTGTRRAAFLSLNNVAFFSGFVLTMIQVNQGKFWVFSLIYGAVLTGLTLLARRLRPEDRAFRNTYLTQGLLLITLGLVTHYTGLRLSLLLAFESVALVMLGRQLGNRVIQIGSYVTSVLTVAVCLPRIHEFDRHGLITGATVGAAMLFNAFWLRRETKYEESDRHPPTVCFTLLALAAWLVTSWQNTASDWRAVVLAVESALFLPAARPLGNRMLALGSMGFAALALSCQSFEFMNRFDPAAFPLQTGLAQGVIVSALLLLNASWFRNQTTYAGSVRHAQTCFYTLLVLVACLETSWEHTGSDWRALVLTIGSMAFLCAARPLHNRMLEFGAVAFAALGAAYQTFVFAALPQENFPLHTGLTQGALAPVLLLFNAWWFRKDTAYERSLRHEQTVFFTAAALLTGLETTWEHTGLHGRALMLALEASALLVLARPLGNRVLEIGSLVFSGIALGFQSFDFLNQYYTVPLAARTGWPEGVLVGALLLGNALWQRRLTPPVAGRMFDPPVTIFSGLALGAWLVTTWVFVDAQYLAPVLAMEALLFTAAYYPLRLAEITLFGQVFLLLAQLLWIIGPAASHAAQPWWNPAAVIAATLGVSSWWQRQNMLNLKVGLRQAMQGLYALAVVGLLYFWLCPRFAAEDWLALASLLALLLTAYGVLARYWLLAAAGQILLVVSGWEFVRQLLSSNGPAWYFPLAPVFVLALVSFGTVKWFERRPEADPQISRTLLNVGLGYRVVALVMSLWWVHQYIFAREQYWVLSFIGLVLFALAGWRKNQELLIFSGVFTLTGVLRFWAPVGDAPAVYWPNLLALLLLLGQQRVAKLQPENFRMPKELHAGAMVLGALGIWRFLHLWVAESLDESYLTALWSVVALALFVAGMGLRERVYRWLGLGVLACTLGRVVMVDIWTLEIIYRILSFMALGIVLLVLGFLYNKYQERIKEWL